MTEIDNFSALVAHIYDAALDPSRWPWTLEQAGGFIGAVQGSIFWHDSAVSQAHVLHISGEHEHYTRLYLERYVRMNPMFPASTFLEPGVVYAATDIVPYDEFIRTRFYQEWVKPQGILDALAANLERSATGSALVAFRLLEKDSPAGPEPRRRMALLVPHIQRAMSIGHLIIDSSRRSAAMARTLDKLSAGVFLVDERGRVVYSNALGDRLTERRTLMRISRGKLAAVDPAAANLLSEALRRAIVGDAELGIRGVEIRLPGLADERWLANVLPLTGGARRGLGKDFEAAVAVFVRKASLDTPSALAKVALAHRLTASEVRTLVAVMETGGVAQMAEEMGVSIATVKTHLQRLFAKTGTRRQADLVKLVAGHSTGDFISDEAADMDR